MKSAKTTVTRYKNIENVLSCRRNVTDFGAMTSVQQIMVAKQWLDTSHGTQVCNISTT